jgi:cytochrome o ubiquinol oxidase subunit 1
MLAMLTLERYLDFHFFTNELGGNAMMYINLFWARGHPEVYILELPAFGVFSEIISTFTSKRLFGYKSMIYASGAISILGFIVWLHHFFTMGSGANVNAFFGVMTMVIAVPTEVKLFNWLLTIYRSRLRITAPVLWMLGFMVTLLVLHISFPKRWALNLMNAGEKHLFGGY